MLENLYFQAYLLDPSSRDWKLGLGLAQSLMAQEKFPESANLIGTLIEENPNDKQLWLQQTNAYLAMERKDDAIVNLESLRLKGMADEANLNLLGNLHMDLLSREEVDEDKRASLVTEARTNYQLAARIETVSYAANLALGQMLVRERRYPDALVHLQLALGLKNSESLAQYTSRVRRAADRLEDKKKSS